MDQPGPSLAARAARRKRECQLDLASVWVGLQQVRRDQTRDARNQAGMDENQARARIRFALELPTARGWHRRHVHQHWTALEHGALGDQALIRNRVGNQIDAGEHLAQGLGRVKIDHAHTGLRSASRAHHLPPLRRKRRREHAAQHALRPEHQHGAA